MKEITRENMIAYAKKEAQKMLDAGEISLAGKLLTAAGSFIDNHMFDFRGCYNSKPQAGSVYPFLKKFDSLATESGEIIPLGEMRDGETVLVNDYDTDGNIFEIATGKKLGRIHGWGDIIRS